MLVSRRRLIKGALGGGALIAAGVPACVLDAAPVTTATVSPDGRVRLPLHRYPDLVPVGGALAIHLLGDSLPRTARDGVLLVHRGSDSDPPQFVATQATCPHAGCPLGYSSSDRLIECPCHGSRFRAAGDPMVMMSCTGDVIQSPARQGLAVFPVGFEPVTGLINIDLLERTPTCGTLLPPVVDGKVTLALSEFPVLANPGGSLIGQPAGLADKLVVVRVDASTVDALSAICTHMGCTIAYSGPREVLDCPCHGSEYALDGSVLMGPAMQPLRSYPTTFDGSTIVIGVA
jgi:Rieske Fe-S protein